ncbi:MAG: hypothetical protein RI980_1147 [Bacteroidota bacterium]|jgi:hypothetical protein
MALKPGPKRIATSTGKPDQRQRDNKETPGNTSSLKPSKSNKKIDLLTKVCFVYIQVSRKYLTTNCNQS